MSSFQQLYSVLQAEHRAAKELLTILKKERAALVESDADVITTLTASKQPLIVQLEQLSRQREAIIQAEGFSSGKGRLEVFIDNQYVVYGRLLLTPIGEGFDPFGMLVHTGNECQFLAACLFKNFLSSNSNFF